MQYVQCVGNRYTFVRTYTSSQTPHTVTEWEDRRDV